MNKGIRVFVVLQIFTMMLLFGCAAPQAPVKDLFYPDAPAEPRLQYLMTFARESDFQETSAFEDWLLGPDIIFDGLARPYAVAATRGRIYIHDRKYAKVFVVDLNKRTLGLVEDDRDREGAFKYPGGMYVEPDGTLFVADMGRRQVVVLDSGDNFVRTYGGPDMFERPVDVAVHEDRVYVCDIEKKLVHVLDRMSGDLVGVLGGPGSEPGKFSVPTHVVVDGRGMVYVSDTVLGRVSQFDTDGRFVKSFGVLSDVTGGMVRPKGIAVDREQRLYVVDAAFQNVQIFRQDVQLLLFFGGASYGRGGLSLPAGITIDYDNVPYFQEYISKDFDAQYLVYVTSLDGPNKINVYAFGTWKGGERAVEDVAESEQGVNEATGKTEQ